MIIDGKALSLEVEQKIQKQVARMKVAPKLVVFSVGKNVASDSYIKRKKAFAKRVGITLIHISLPSTSEKAATKILQKKLKQENPDAVIVQIPISKKWDVDRFLQNIPPELDVDCLSGGKKYFLSPVLLSVKDILHRNNIEPKGKNVVIVGAGRLVGKPALEYFKNVDAKVAICDIRTKNVPAITKKADILISGAGAPHIITSSMVKRGVVVLDVGFSLVKGSIMGDIDPRVATKASIFSPVPGGIGAMTVAYLFFNVLRAKKRQNKAKN